VGLAGAPDALEAEEHEAPAPLGDFLQDGAHLPAFLFSHFQKFLGAHRRWGKRNCLDESMIYCKHGKVRLDWEGSPGHDGGVDTPLNTDGQVRALSERLRPVLSEFGVEYFVLSAYFKDGEGRTRKLSVGGCPADEEADQACVDGLRRMEELSAAWGRGLI
jgi:hypothetical protein